MDVSTNLIMVEAVFEGGVLRPVRPLPLSNHQTVTLTLRLPGVVEDWPENVAAIYQEIAEEDRRLASAMAAAVQQTWPVSEDHP
jgi:predicted DNA-binding antitoxin AbrB/MazE fold protein